MSQICNNQQDPLDDAMINVLIDLFLSGWRGGERRACFIMYIVYMMLELFLHLCVNVGVALCRIVKHPLPVSFAFMFL